MGKTWSLCRLAGLWSSVLWLQALPLSVLSIPSMAILWEKSADKRHGGSQLSSRR